MKIALIAHEKKKEALITFEEENKDTFKLHDLYATGTTGKRLIEETGLEVHRFKSGPLGGDQEIGSMVANGNIDIIIFFRDPLTAQPHEPDVSRSEERRVGKESSTGDDAVGTMNKATGI